MDEIDEGDAIDLQILWLGLAAVNDGWHAAIGAQFFRPAAAGQGTRISS